MFKRFLTIMIAGAMFLFASALAAYAVDHYPTELSKYVSSAYTGVTLFTPAASPTLSDGATLTQTVYTYLIDMDGRQVHRWPWTIYTPWQAQLLETDGHILGAINNPAPVGAPTILGGGGEYGLLEEADWNGNILNTWNTFTTYSGRWFRGHHDMQKIYNTALGANTIIFIAWQYYSVAEGEALNPANPSTMPSLGWTPDAIYEMDMNGNILWMWAFYDHTTTDNNPAKLNVNLNNTYTTGLAVDWNHINSLDYNVTNGYIVFNSRNVNEFYVIDHDGTFVAGNPAQSIANAASTAGDFIYRFGAPMNYTHPTPDGDTVDRATWGKNGTIQMWGAHCINWTKPNFYGYQSGPPYTLGPAMTQGPGNFIIWDNHASNNNPLGGGSHVLEIDPTIMSRKVGATAYVYIHTSDGSYYPPNSVKYASETNSAAGLGFGGINRSIQVVWDYYTNHASSLNSGHISGVQRLPNGNTIACSGEMGHFVEVQYNSPNTLVWEYINPIANGVPVRYIENPSTSSANQVFRCYRWDIGHPGIAKRVRSYGNGTIMPKVIQTGDGATLTGAAPCTLTPCNSGTGVGGF